MGSGSEAAAGDGCDANDEAAHDARAPRPPARVLEGRDDGGRSGSDGGDGASSSCTRSELGR